MLPFDLYRTILCIIHIYSNSVQVSIPQTICDIFNATILFFGVAIILEHMYLYVLHHTYFYKFYENFDEGTILFFYKNVGKS